MAFGTNIRSTLPTEGVKCPLGSLGSIACISCHDIVGNQLFFDTYSKKAISAVRSVPTHIV